MKRTLEWLWIAGLIAALCAAVLWLSAGTAQALPEYSAQTGEPCATCHLSPSGGGPRGVRGQAWVGSGKPGTAPTLDEALAVLGIRLANDPADFQAKPASVVPPALRPVQPPGSTVKEQRTATEYHEWLVDYGGN